MTKAFNTEDLIAAAKYIIKDEKCPNCQDLACPGWETMPSSFNQDQLDLIGTLKSENEESWNEYHPKSTQIWSADAPIAPNFHPYNKCDVYQCQNCTQMYLRYTEYGGYYVDQRIRLVTPELIDGAINA